MIPKSTAYALIRDDTVIARGSKRDMEKLRKKDGGTVGLGFGPVGSSIKKVVVTPEPNLPAEIKHYRDAKSLHPNMIVLFHKGDYYEAFEDDAISCATTLEIKLTERDDDFAAAQFPVRYLEPNLHALLRAGYQVAICEQIK